jgi:hypothetical protein
VALLLEAERLAANGTARPWTLANAWHALGEASAVERVLDAALRAATTADAAVHVAHAWASQAADEPVLRAHARARELATSASDWLKIAEAALDAGLGDEPVRSALTQAAALATDREVRTRVASAFSHWLGDDQAAERVGPRGAPADALRPRIQPLPGWESSGSALFDWLRTRMTPELLTRIAHADYGMDADKHLAALRDLCATGLVPNELAWEPHEVLALCRWSSGERVNHLERAFCCVLLCLAPSGLEELVTNGPILAESCLELGPEPTALAQQLFAWIAETREADDPERFFAKLLLYLLATASSVGDPRLEPLARELCEQTDPDLNWAAESIAGSMRAEIWTDLFERLLAPRRMSDAHIERLLSALGR